MALTSPKTLRRAIAGETSRYLPPASLECLYYAQVFYSIMAGPPWDQHQPARNDHAGFHWRSVRHAHGPTFDRHPATHLCRLSVWRINCGRPDPRAR